jgi:hypothetical protein
MVAATAVDGAALTVYVEPAPPAPVLSAVMVVPRGTLLPDIVMPTTITPDVTDVTVSVVEPWPMEPTKTGAVTAEMDVETATVGGVLTTHVHGAVAHEPPTMEVMVVPEGTLAPDSVMPTSSVPDAMADTVSVVVLTGIEPVKAALGSTGLTPSPAGQ